MSAFLTIRLWDERGVAAVQSVPINREWVRTVWEPPLPLRVTRIEVAVPTLVPLTESEREELVRLRADYAKAIAALESLRDGAVAIVGERRDLDDPDADWESVW